jgi:hypothetical protein
MPRTGSAPGRGRERLAMALKTFLYENCLLPSAEGILNARDTA